MPSIRNRDGAGSGRAGLGHPAHRVAAAEVGDAGVRSAPSTSVRRWAANVRTWAIIPPYVKTSGGSQIASTNVSSSRPSSTIARTWPRNAGPTRRAASRMSATLSCFSTSKSYGRSCVAASHIASWPTRRESSERSVGSQSMPSTESSTGVSRTSSCRRSARVEHLADEPDVMLDHAGEQIHAGHLSDRRGGAGPPAG